MATKQMLKEREQDYKMVTALADAHCHADLMSMDEINEAVRFGVRTIIADGVDTKSNIRVSQLHDGKHVYAMLGVDPEHCIGMSDDELEFNINMARTTKGIVGIGEIGLDRGGRIGNFDRQRMVFERFLDVAKEMDLPVSVHSRNTIDEVLQILEGKGIRKAHIHFFEGNAEQCKRVEKLGYMISIPPLESAKRRKVIKEMSIDNIMVESDSPVAVKSPKDVRKAVEMIAEEKRIAFERAAEAVVLNTRRFFNIDVRQHSTFMRS
jgi:TatD DNase family protein